jgi:8-oxo-dGTP pyrophosphatase MutT (NUDIX family)
MENEWRGVVFILISTDNRILLQQRDHRDLNYSGMWCFPGGACDENEDYPQTLVREAKEEFDANLNPLNCTLLMKRLESKNWVYACPIGDNQELKLLEGADMRWYSLEEVEKIPLGWNQSDILPVLRSFCVKANKAMLSHLDPHCEK